MISRFPSSPLFRRLICCLLALATVCLCLAPALVQPALALAGIDDATLAVGLLFCSWAGVTFATNQGAASAVTSFLNSSVNGLKACSEVASKYVVDGSLALVQGVKDAFESILPDINSTFQTQGDSLSGSLAGGVSLGASYSCPVSKSFLNHKDASAAVFPTTIDSFRVDFNDLYVIYTKNSSGTYVSDSGSVFGPSSPNYSYFGLTYALYDGYAHAALYIIGVTPAGKVETWSYKNSFWGLPNAWVDGITPVVTILSSSDTVDFQRSKEIDGTQIQEITFVPGGVWEPSPDDPTQPDMSQWPGLSLAALLALLANQNSDSPNLDPEKMIEELRQALNGGSGGGDGPTVTDPTISPTDPGSSGGDAADAPPDFKNMMLPGLKDFFPFCIPFDIYNMMSALCAEPVAPKFTFATSFLGRLYSVDIDLSAWDNVAIMIRYMVVAIYIVSLAVATRKFIKW